jgi:hypothetical protein
LPVTSVSVPRGPASLQTLLEEMVRSPSQNFVVVTHGEIRGLIVRLANGNNRPVGMSAFDRALERLMRIAAGDRTRSPMQITTQDSSALQLTSAQIGELIRLMGEVRRKNIGQLEFRSCIIGRDLSVAQSFQRFFGARRLGAPQLFNSFVYGSFTIASSPAANHRTGGWRVVRYDLQRGGVVHVCVQPTIDPNTNLYKVENMALYADRSQSAHEWARQFLAPNASYTGSIIPLHYMFGSPPLNLNTSILASNTPELAWPMTNLYKDRIRYIFA